MPDRLPDLRVVKLSRLSQRSGEVKGPHIDAVDSLHAQDLLQAVQAFRRLALGQQHRLAVRDLEIVLQALPGIVLIPEAAPRRGCHAPFSKRQILAVFDDSFHLVYPAHIRDHKAHHPDIQLAQDGLAADLAHPGKRRHPVQLRRPYELQRGLGVVRPVFVVDDEIVQSSEAQALGHGGASRLKKGSEGFLPRLHFLLYQVFHCSSFPSHCSLFTAVSTISHASRQLRIS